MKPLSIFVLAFWTFTFAGIAAQTGNPFDVPDHLAETWWTDAEQMAFFTNRIPIDAKLAKALADNLPAPKDPKDQHEVKQLQETRQRLTNQPPFATLADFFAFNRPTNDALRSITVQLSRHTNVAVQFFALLQLAGEGERTAAETILKFPRRTDLSARDIEIMRNIFHGIGIDAIHDTPAFVVGLARRLGADRDERREPDKLPIGTVAPEFEIKTLKGKAMHLSDYRGKTVLLHFWSTSCGPCIGEFPEMTKALRSLLQRRQDLVVLAVSLDDNRKTIQGAVKKYDLGDWTHLCDGRGWASVPARLYHITGIPSDVVIDPKGIIRADSWRTLEGMLGTVGIQQ